MKRFLIAVAVVFSACEERVDFPCTICGTVTDAKAPHAPLSGVSVSFDGGNPVYTNAAGQYSVYIPALQEESYRLEFILSGYLRDRTETRKLTRKTETVNFQMRKQK